MNLRKLASWGSRGSEATKTYEESPLPALQREIDRLFEGFFSRDFGFPIATRGLLSGGPLSPQIDVDETDGEIRVTAELPGMDEEDVDVTLIDDMLTITGEKKVAKETEEKHFHQGERSFGRFERRVVIPVSVDENKISATFKKGVLEITLPKTEVEEEAVRHIEVKAA